MEIHSNLRPFNCKQCDMTFKQNRYLIGHIKRMHTVKILVPCELCGKMFSSLATKDKHLKSVHLKETQYPCPHEGCRIAVPSPAHLKIHLQSHLPRDQRQVFHCLEKACDKRFFTQNGMMNHHRTTHERKGLYCPHCNKVVAKESDLKRHIVTHTLERNFPCPQCGKQFARKSNMLRHVKNVHESESTTKIWNRSKSFQTRFGVGRHERTHLKKGDAQKWKIFRCFFCPNWFQFFSTLKSHMGTHTREKPFKCPKCSKKFIRVSDIKPHIASRHVKMEFRKHWNCDECNAVFWSKYVMVRHVEIKHRGILRYQCNLCSKRKSSMENLENHIRVHHTQEMPFRCSVKGCKYRALTRSGLQNHLKKGTYHNNS